MSKMQPRKRKEKQKKTKTELRMMTLKKGNDEEDAPRKGKERKEQKKILNEVQRDGATKKKMMWMMQLRKETAKKIKLSSG